MERTGKKNCVGVADGNLSKANAMRMSPGKPQKKIEILKGEDKENVIDLYYFDESGFTGVLEIPYAWQDENEQLLLPSRKTSRINVLGFLNKRAVGQTYSYHQQNSGTEMLTGSRLSVTESYKNQQV